jgi:hypothetical protein
MLVSDAASFVTCTTIEVSGGFGCQLAAKPNRASGPVGFRMPILTWSEGEFVHQ